MAGCVWTLLSLLGILMQTSVVTQAGTTRRVPNIQDAMLSYMCRGLNARICSGNGVCQSGRCVCNTGYSGDTCAVSDFQGLQAETTMMADDTTTTVSTTNLTACTASEGQPCNGRGVCERGQCRCEPLYSGFTCELSMREGFCKTYLECAECIALLKKGCPESCKIMANFQLVFGFKVTPSPYTCRHRNVEHSCVFYYKLDSEDPQGFKTIQVLACIPGLETTPATTASGVQRVGEMDMNVGGPGSGAGGAGTATAAVMAASLLLHTITRYL